MREANYSPNGVLVETLTWREQDVLSLLAERQTNREIAQALGLELTTVKWYNKQLFSKLNVSSRYEAVEKAEEYGLLDEEPIDPAIEGGPAKGRLPVQLSSFVGREREMAEIRELLNESHLLTLTGPAGTGKTRLALQVAHAVADGGAFTNGVYFIDLAPIGQPELVGDAIAEALGVIVASGQPVAESLKRFLGNKKILLVVDNFEHVIKAAPLVSDLLSSAPGLIVLVTSREVLNIYGEQDYPVPPLALPDDEGPDSPSTVAEYESVSLFVQRARAARPDFALTDENAQTVAAICTRLDGLPLAIELAAARTRMYAPEALLDALDDRMSTLRGGLRDLPARQQTLRGAIDWSYELLDEGEKQLFERLAVFQGGRTIAAVEAVCSHDLSLDVLDGLESLLTKNLLRHEDGPEGEPRFVTLETIHEYGREKLEAGDDADDMRRRHAEYFAALAERLHPDTRGGPDQMRWFRRLDADYDNLRSALAWSLGGADVELGMRLTGALGYFWFRWHHLADGQRWTVHALEADPDGAAPPQVRAGALLAAGLLTIFQDDRVTGKQHQREAAALYREVGDEQNLGWALVELSSQSIGYGDEYDEAVALCEEGLALLREVDDKAGVAYALNILGELARRHGEYDVAKDAYEETLAIARDTGDTLRETKQYVNLGFVAQHHGDYHAARARFQQFLSSALEIDFKPSMAYSLVALAGPAAALGDLERAARLLGAGFAQFGQLGVIPQLGDRPEFERIQANVQEQLDEATFETAWAEGAAMSLEEAIAYALEEAGAEG